MAYGRKDYFWGMAPEKSVFGELQIQWQEIDAGSIAGNQGTADYIDYTVPAGYILNLTGLILGSRSSGITQWYVYRDAVVVGFGYFDTQMHMSYGQGGEIIFSPGEVFKVTLVNFMEYTIFYGIDAYGFLQQTIV